MFPYAYHFIITWASQPGRLASYCVFVYWHAIGMLYVCCCIINRPLAWYGVLYMDIISYDPVLGSHTDGPVGIPV